MSAKELALLEMFGGSADPQYVPDSSLFRKGDRVTLADGTLIDSLAAKPVGEKDEGAVQSGGARRSRRRQRRSRKTRHGRMSRKGRGRSLRKRK